MKLFFFISFLLLLSLVDCIDLPTVAYAKLKGKPSCAYSAEIEVGGTVFYLLVDTGSSNLAVPSQNCSCKDPKGATFQGPLTSESIGVQYGSGSWNGFVAYSTFDIPDSTNSTLLQNFPIAVITEQNTFFIEGCPNDGIIGMGYSSIDVMGLPIPIVQESKTKNMPYGFAVYMCGNSSSSSTSYKNGNMWWGGYDNFYILTPMMMVDILHESYYVVLWNGVNIGNNPIPFIGLNYVYSIVDTGTTQLIFQTQSNANTFIQSIKNSGIIVPTPTGADAEDFWLGKKYLVGYSVNQSIDITFQFFSVNGIQNVKFPISNLFPTNNNMVAFMYQLIGYGSNENIIGIAFLEGQVVFFDRGNNQIGFALGDSEKCQIPGSSANINVFAGAYSSGYSNTISILFFVCLVMFHFLLKK